MRNDVIFNISDKLIKLGAIFAISIFAARVLQRDEYGIFVYINVILSIAIAFITSGIDTTITKRLSQDKFVDLGFVASATAIKLVLAAIASIFIYYHIRDKYPQYSILLGVAGSTACLAGAIGYSEVLLTAMRKNRAMLYCSISILIPLGAIKAAALLQYKNPIGKYFIDAIEFLLLTSVAYFILRKNITQDFRKNLVSKRLWKILKDSYPLWLNGVILVAYSRYDQLFVGAVGSQGDIADYAIATQMNTIALIVPTSILTVAFPKLIELRDVNTNEYELSVIRLYRIMLAYGVAWVAAVYLFGQLAIDTLYGPNYTGAAVYLKILSIGVVFMAIGQVSGQWTIIEGRYWNSIKRSLAGIAFMAAASYMTASKSDITTIALITIANLFLVNIAMYFLLKGNKDLIRIIGRALGASRKTE